MTKNSEKEQVNLKNFILQNRIGKGSFGKVYKMKKNLSDEIYAAKVLINDIDSLSDDELSDFVRELNIISKLNHPSVLKFIGFSPIDFKKRSKPVLVTE